MVGNVTEKRGVSNPVSRYLVRQFDARIARIMTDLAPSTIMEVGCGEGEMIKLALDNTAATIVGADISDAVLATARKNVSSKRVRLEKMSIYDIPIDQEFKAELVVCCEVLEHLEDPRAGLEKLHALTESHCLLSVPREPVWRALNMVRLAYLRDWGNTPGHLQHWSRRAFVNFVSELFEVTEVHTPLPWTIALCRKKQSLRPSESRP
ncbi:hypothetical protein PSDVSF_32600 [Pseudodesulfovibrio sediminis]|uniref:Methyltransferase domain-containing protein n=1 Tax=Pseudodesulfovibrio sediminis TaxID=2810563 RepID=A0ABN6EWY2_9BACT|nr:hypothetical protein PSDVSF_32600 [Pseudodesulfovibrio sediminis]